MTAVQKLVLLPTKHLSDNKSRFRHSFGVEASLSLNQSAPALPNNTTNLCWLVVT